MRFMVLVPGDERTEAGVMPTTEELAAMGEYNQQLADAGVMISGEGLHPTSKGKRVRYADGDAAVIDGPFSESKELVAGFWIWECESMEDAVAWLKKAPFEIRQVFEADDFGEAFTPELREQEDRIRAKIGDK
ncbi:MAG: YciI family protein [Solirubrobacterales bacterium]